MNGTAKSWIASISVLAFIVSGIGWYIYAEATGSRSRDEVATTKRAELRAYVVEGDNKLRDKIYEGQMKQMDLLHEIKEKVVVVQTDLDILKDKKR
jgi:hypothetical protein